VPRDAHGVEDSAAPTEAIGRNTGVLSLIGPIRIRKTGDKIRSVRLDKKLLLHVAIVTAARAPTDPSE
jgi:hypothetical protein